METTSNNDQINSNLILAIAKILQLNQPSFIMAFSVVNNKKHLIFQIPQANEVDQDFINSVDDVYLELLEALKKQDHPLMENIKKLIESWQDIKEADIDKNDDGSINISFKS